MYRYFILFCLIASQADAQSIVLSGGDRSSIVVSGKMARIVSPPTPVPMSSNLWGLNKTRLEDLEMRLDFLESTLKAATEKPVVKPVVELVIHPAKKQRQWYLVSESWCPNCPAAKTRFRRLGWPESNILTIAQCEKRFGFRPPHVPFEFGEPERTKTTHAVATQVPSQMIINQRNQGRYYLYHGNIYDLETYGGCSMRNCGMCAEIRAAQQRYRASRQLINEIGPQAPSPDDVITEGVALLSPTLTPESVLWEPGCGDARVSIAVVKECIRKYGTGCKVFGTELDPIKAQEARRRVLASGLSGWIKINLDKDGDSCSDALEFDPVRHGVTHCYAYLDHFLLQEIAGKLSKIKTVVSPGHECVGIGMRLAGQCWVKGV